MKEGENSNFIYNDNHTQKKIESCFSRKVFNYIIGWEVKYFPLLHAYSGLRIHEMCIEWGKQSEEHMLSNPDPIPK